MSETRTTTVYLQVRKGEPTAYGQRYPGFSAATVTGSTSSRPERVKPGHRVVKLILRVPEALWDDVSAEVTVEVPAPTADRAVTGEAVAQ